MRLVYLVGTEHVGKSVCSAATGIWTSIKGKKTLVFSMDSANSLSDLFGVGIGNLPTHIGDHLDAVAPDLVFESKKLFDKYENLFKAMFEMFELGVKPEDFGMVPGVSELIFMDRLYDHYMEGKYDVLVINSTPTALILPLLKSPEVSTEVVTRLLGMKSRWTQFFNLQESGFGDAILLDVRRLRSKAETMKNVLLNPKITTITVVLIPEKTVMSESERLIENLQDRGASVDSLIVNRVMQECECHYCRKRQEVQRSYLDKIKQNYMDKDITLLHSYGEEINGKKLMKVAEKLYGNGQLKLKI